MVPRMRSIDSIRLIWVILTLVGFLSGAQAQTDQDTAETDRAVQEFDKGNTIAALSMTGGRPLAFPGSSAGAVSFGSV